MKLCSKYNKSNEKEKVNPHDISVIIVEHLNMILKHDFENEKKEITNKIVARVKSTDL